MKTVTELKTLAITRTNAEGKTEIVKLLDCKNPGQMWKALKGQALFNEYGADVTITAYKTDDTAYMSFTLETTKSGRTVMKQGVVENRRGQVLKAKKAAAIARAKKDARNAKARARYAAKKRAVTIENTAEATTADAE